MADHGHARRLRRVLLGAVRLAAGEPYPERRKIRIRRLGAVDHFRRAGLRDVDALVLEERHVLEHLVVLPVEEEKVRRQRELVEVEAWRRAPDVDQPVGMWIRQRLEQHAVDDAEDGGDGADAERQRERRNDQEPRLLSEAAASVTEVFEDRSHG